MTDPPPSPPAPRQGPRYTQSIYFSKRSLESLHPATILGPGIVSRKLVEAFREPACLLVSFPRAGRTWLRVMLAHAFEELFDVRSAKPLDTDATARLTTRIPRVITTPGYRSPRTLRPGDLDRRLEWADGRQVVLLFRDPRDILVSLYFDRTVRASHYPEARAFDGTVSDLLRAEAGGLRTIIEYYNVWAERARRAPGLVQLITYEHLTEDTALEFGRLLAFLGLEHSRPFVEGLVRHATFDHVRRMEVSGRLGYKPTAELLHDERALVLRRGVVGGYRDHFTADDHAYAAERLASLDGWYGCSA
jgi:hypothetical protein